MWYLKSNSLVTGREVTFAESLALLAKSDYDSVYMNLDGVQLKVELQPVIHKIG